MTDPEARAAAIRRETCARRRSLTPEERTRTADRLARHVRTLSAYEEGRRLGAYLAVNGEASLDAVIREAWEDGRAVYVPVLVDDPDIPMRFRRLTPDAVLNPNRFGIPEPDAGMETLAAADLDLVLCPLVAFDRAGHRLGMGGGFYDRTFSFLKDAPGPLLAGVAYAWQERPDFPVHAWDVPLRAVVTDKEALELPLDGTR